MLNHQVLFDSALLQMSLGVESVVLVLSYFSSGQHLLAGYIVVWCLLIILYRAQINFDKNYTRAKG